MSAETGGPTRKNPKPAKADQAPTKGIRVCCFEYHPPLPWLLNRTEVPGLPGPGPAVLTIEPGDPGRAGCVFQLTRAGPGSRKSRKKPGRVRAGSCTQQVTTRLQSGEAATAGEEGVNRTVARQSGRAASAGGHHGGPRWATRRSHPDSPGSGAAQTLRPVASQMNATKRISDALFPQGFEVASPRWSLESSRKPSSCIRRSMYPRRKKFFLSPNQKGFFFQPQRNNSRRQQAAAAQNREKCAQPQRNNSRRQQWKRSCS